MPAIDTYSAGTVTLTNNSAVVTGAAVNWISGGKYNVFGGHWFRYGSFVSLILNVDSATQLTLATPYTGATVAGASYQVFRYTRLETPEAVGLLQSVLDRGSASSPFGRLDIDSGALRASFRDDGSGKLGWYVSASGVADGSQTKALTLDRTNGVMSDMKLANSVIYSTGLVNPVTAATDSERGGLQLRNTFAGATVAGDIINMISFAGAGSSNRRRAGIASIQDGEALPPTALGFFVNGSTVVGQDAVVERVRIAASGKVGIGVAAPVALLDVAGDFQCSSHLRVLGGSQIYQMGGPARLNYDVGQYFTLREGLTTVVQTDSATKSFKPGSDNTQPLGTASLRWSVVYAGTGSINTSDAREKAPVRPFASAEIAAARDLLAEIGVFQWLASISAKGEDGARLHIGMTVQRAIEIMESHGLDPWRYGFICRDDITRTVKVMQTQMVPAAEDVAESYSEIEIREGVPVRVQKTRVVQRPLESLVAIVDESGQPVTRTSQNEDGSFTVEPLMHPVPVMVAREVEVEIEEPAGDRLGFRYDQLTLFLMRGLVSRVAELDA